MESAKPLDTGLMESDETPKARRGSLVTDDSTIYDELIAPLEATMMRSIWRVVRNADLAEDCLQHALAVIWKKRFQMVVGREDRHAVEIAVDARTYLPKALKKYASDPSRSGTALWRSSFTGTSPFPASCLFPNRWQGSDKSMRCKVQP